MAPLASWFLVLGTLVGSAVPAVLAQDWESDGRSPYGTGFAPDVVLHDSSWNETYPDFEGQIAPNLEDCYHSSTGNDSSWSNLDRREAKDFYLRLMPLGASITEGYRSTDGNGYRKWIRSQLRWKGWKVNMVGSKQDGNMADKDNEGHPGFHVDQVHSEFTKSKGMKPNLVLINAGTNDCNFNDDPDHAGGRMKNMVDDIFDSIPGVSVVISTLGLSRDHQSCADDVSRQYRELYASYGSDRLGMADLSKYMTPDMLHSDGIHPNDAGYKLFASLWWDAIRKLESKIQPPAAVDGLDDSAVTNPGKTCKKVAGNASGPVQTQKGSGHDDGPYVHKSTDKGALTDARIQKGGGEAINNAIPSHMFFAQLVSASNLDRSEALDDWIRVLHGSDGKNTYYFRQNLGSGRFGSSQTIDVDMNCDSGPNYAWADFNNDGLADFWCLGANSKVHISLNRGGNPPRFESIGQAVPEHSGFVSADVRVADIDGDGRADYCVVHDNGDVGCSRNGGQGDKYYWQGFSTPDGIRGIVFPGKNKGDKRGVTFGDLSGSFRSSWMWIGDQGDVDTWINMRGYGKGIIPEWNHVGTTHQGVGTAGVRDQIKFGRIYGSGRLDYIYIKEESNYYDVHVWENNGHGGTNRKGDGNFYCDMRGLGSDDYVWIYNDGSADEIFTNIHSPPDWGHETKITLNVSGPREGIHLADWTGNGRCDVLVQDKATGALTLHENSYDATTDSISFTNKGVVTGAATCDQGWGVGIFDRGMRVADIDGDGRADALCIEPDGRITAWLNTASGLKDAGQVKFSEGWDRANMRLADVEASGRADLIHLDKYTGAATVYQNLGHTPGGKGSSHSWANRGVLYSPIDRGENMNFANQGGLGRADLVHVLPISNRADTYFNNCGTGSGGDDGPITDPDLPSY